MKSSTYTMLIVEDDPYDSKLILRAIRKARILNPTRLIENGASAIAYLAGTPPYEDREAYPLPVVLLLDLKLPKQSGFEVLEWLRAQPTLSRLPVVVLTSSAESSDVNRAYDLGANSYLVKPVDSDALVDMLKTVELYWLFSNTKPDLE
jgi:CheY-like chemotaxis protein